mmetsp:Transcript_36112/g.81312  ORF Transcript_36112/g.81312 Transcript_36112/m.81312 type:complete len:178 (-) Transcript_36112:97-630(-)
MSGGRPKRPMSAWLLFCEAKRDEVKRDNPEIAFTEINKVIAGKWKALTEEEKKPFEEEAAKRFEEYKGKKALYEAECGDVYYSRRVYDEPEYTGKRRRVKDVNAPKKGQNAYMLWCHSVREDLRKANPDMAMKDILRELGQKWKDLDPSEKEKWEEKAKEDRDRFLREKEEYESIRY